MKHIALRPHITGLDHKLNDLFNKILFCNERNVLPVFIVPSFGCYHDFLDSGLVLTGKQVNDVDSFCFVIF